MGNKHTNYKVFRMMENIWEANHPIVGVPLVAAYIIAH